MAPRGHNRYPEHHLEAEVGRSRHGDPHLEHPPSPKGKSGDRYQSLDPDAGRPRASWEEEAERAARRKEKPNRPPPPHSPVDRERRRDRQRKEHWEERRERDWDRGPGHVWDQDNQRQRVGTRSRDRGLDEEGRGRGRERAREGRGSWEEERDYDGGDRRERRAARGRHRVPSGPGDVFEEEQRRDEARARQHWEETGSPSRRHFDSHLVEETGTAESPAHPPPPPTLLFLLLGSAGGACVLSAGAAFGKSAVAGSASWHYNH